MGWYYFYFLGTSNIRPSQNNSNKKLKSKKGCNCLPGCNELAYTQQQTSGPLSRVLDIKQEYKADKSKEYFL